MPNSVLLPRAGGRPQLDSVGVRGRCTPAALSDALCATSSPERPASRLLSPLAVGTVRGGSAGGAPLPRATRRPTLPSHEAGWRGSQAHRTPSAGGDPVGIQIPIPDQASGPRMDVVAHEFHSWFLLEDSLEGEAARSTSP